MQLDLFASTGSPLDISRDPRAKGYAHMIRQCWRGWHFYEEGFVANRRWRYVLYRCSHGCPDELSAAEHRHWSELPHG